jgi:hypothetical protein
MMFIQFMPAHVEEAGPCTADPATQFLAAGRNCLLLLKQAQDAEEARLFLAAFMANWGAMDRCVPDESLRQQPSVEQNIRRGLGAFEGIQEICDRFHLWEMVQPAPNAKSFLTQ